MEYIQALQNLVQDYWVLSLCVGFFSTFIESFIPMLPLVALITANAALFGMLKGFLISWLGSVMGTICLFLIIYKIGENSKILDKIKSDKIKKAILWIEKRGFKLLFIAYACPFLPACVITIASGISKRHKTTFISAVLSGKFIMFLVISYIGQDIYGFITSPVKIIGFCAVVFIAWKLGNKLNKDLDYIEEKVVNKEKEEQEQEEYIEANKKVR